MKRVGLWAVMGIGLFLTVGLLTVEPGYTEEKEHEPTCTLKTLKGRYLFGGITTLLDPDAPDPLVKPQLLAIAGYHTFNGDGTGTDIVTVTINGVLVRENFVTPITYTVNPDCSGTIAILATGESLSIFIAPHGEELIAGGDSRPSFRAQNVLETEDDPPPCTLKTLKGRYLFGGIATLLPPAVPQQSLLEVAGYHIFNGDGTGTDIVTALINGESVEKNAGENPDRSEYDITYTVNPDCSGTYTVPAAGASFGIYVAPNGEALIVIGTNPGTILVQGPSRRVSRK
jgi:hypothetical protein